jgi:putative methyltransferase (TIGR04325 family)
MKSIARAVLPRSIYAAASSLWQQMRVPSESLEGYESHRLVEVVHAKTKALSGRASNMPGAERTMLGVLLAATRSPSRPLRVLDFGGACGFHYMASLPAGIRTQWAVVETPAMAARGELFQTDELRFFCDIDAACAWLGGIDLLHSSSTLQYVPEPSQTLTRLVGLSATVVLWSRMALTDGATSKSLQTSRLAENGPGPMPAGFADALVIYPITRLSRAEFIRAHDRYYLVAEFGEPSVGFLFARS